MLSHVRLFATPWTAARQASLSITNSWSLLKYLREMIFIPVQLEQRESEDEYGQKAAKIGLGQIVRWSMKSENYLDYLLKKYVLKVEYFRRINKLQPSKRAVGIEMEV